MPLSYFYAIDAPYVKVFSPEHIGFLLVCALTIFLFVRFRKKIAERRIWVGNTMLGIVLFQQVFLMYGWYFCVTDELLKQALPLEMCRISSLLTIFFLITKDKRFMDVIFYFSIYALASLVYPKNIYHFLHVNGISYMVNHLMTVITPIFGAIAYGWRPSWKAFRRAAISFTVFLPTVILVNKLTGGNYFYLVDRPFWNGLPLWQFASIAYVGTIAGFALVTWVFEKLLHKQPAIV